MPRCASGPLRAARRVPGPFPCVQRASPWATCSGRSGPRLFPRRCLRFHCRPPGGCLQWARRGRCNKLFKHTRSCRTWGMFNRPVCRSYRLYKSCPSVGRGTDGFLKPLLLFMPWFQLHGSLVPTTRLLGFNYTLSWFQLHASWFPLHVHSSFQLRTESEQGRASRGWS